MSAPAPVPTPDETPAAATPDAAPARARRSPRRVAVLAAAVVVALAAGTVGVVTLLGHREEQAAAQADLDAAVAEMELVRTDFEVWIGNGNGNVDSLVGRVEDEPRLALEDAVRYAESLDTTTPTEGTLEEQTAAVHALRDKLQAAMDDMVGTTSVLAEAQYNWDLRIEQTKYDSALTGLGVAVTTAEQALAAGSGTAEARDAVTAALTAATSTRDAERDFRDIDVVIVGAQDLTAARERLNAAVQALDS